tara:strand:+ start:5417 stop:6043 length:627 start_codon:yes stop_codon:yes gene_type:complete
MATETELKLSIAATDIPAFKAHPAIVEATIKGPEELPLLNTYFDTPDFTLRQHGYGLRIREQQGRFIQTLKAKGEETYAGLHQRQEWETELDGFAIDVTAIPLDEVQKLLKTPASPIFTTDFTRTRWLLEPNPETEIELALDVGMIKAGDKRCKIQEVELELVSGEKQQLFAFAAKLQQDITLISEDRSKASRGYDLLSGSQPSAMDN